MPLISEAARRRVRAYVESNMDAQVSITRGGPGVLNKTTGKVSGASNAVLIYEGKARIHTVTGQGSLSLGPGNIDVRQTTVSIPWAAQVPQRDDLILIRSGGADTALNGAAMRVVEVAGGTLFGDARRCSVTLWGRSAYWDGVKQ